MNKFCIRGLNIRSLCCLMSIAVITGCATSGNDAAVKWVPVKRAEAHVSLGLDYLKRGQFDTAREELDLAISINPKSDTAHHGRGLLSAQQGFVDEARASFARAVKLNPSNFTAVNDSGVYLCQNGVYDKGIAQLEKIESRQDNPLRNNTLLGLGICHYRSNSYEEAKRYLRVVLNASPRMPQALLPMADMSYREQNFLNARAFIERYISVGALSEQALILGANTELQMGDSAKAKQYATELRRNYPSSTEIDTFRKLLNGG